MYQLAYLPQTYTKDQLLSITNTDDYNTEIEILAAYFSDIQKISSDLNITITVIHQSPPSDLKIYSNNNFSNSLSLFIYAINDNNYDHIFPSSYLDDIIFANNQSKTITLQNFINNFLSTPFIEKFNTQQISKIIEFLEPDNDFIEKVDELKILLLNLENKKNDDMAKQLKEELIEKPYIHEYYQSAKIRPGKNFLAIPDENNKNNFRLYKVVGPDGKNIRIGFKSYEELQKITEDPGYVKSFVGDYCIPEIPNAPICQFALNSENPLIPEVSSANPQRGYHANRPYSVFKEEEEFNPD